MKTLIHRIKTAQLISRKARDMTSATLLTTLIGEAEMIGKSAGNRESTDVEVLQVIRKFEKNLIETIGYLEINLSMADNTQKILNMNLELAILRCFLPQKITELQVQNDIESLITALSIPKEQKSMGIIVKELKARYGDQFDGQQVAKIFKAIIA